MNKLFIWYALIYSAQAVLFLIKKNIHFKNMPELCWEKGGLCCIHALKKLQCKNVSKLNG